MLETVLSSVDFRAAGLSVEIRNDRRAGINHIVDGIQGADAAVETDLLATPLGVVEVAQKASISRAPRHTEHDSSLPVGGRLKRVLDVTVSLVALVLLAPLLALIAVAVRVSMGGPVLYRHRRIGFSGVPFDCLKFRSMIACSDNVFQNYLDRNPAAADEWRRKRKLENDPRVTRFGRFLRKTSLDELPQFINVLLGEMSLVGPRPVVSQELELYGANVGEYMRARPGVTGLWQVSGRSSLSFDERVALDSIYVREWGLRKDFSILVQTIPAIFKTFHAV